MYAFRREAKRLLRQVGGSPRKVLDFGCGSGLFTRCLGEALPGAHVIGSDFHGEPPPELAGRPYVANCLLEAESVGFDLVLAMHVIEHDDDPRRLVHRIASLARSGATLVFEVPNVDCRWGSLFGEAWDPWYVPFHRVHFSRTGLRNVIESCGLVVYRELNVCLPSMGRSLANILGSDNNLPMLLAGMALHPLQWGVEKATRQPSALRIIARKPET
jgi:SAM-dependent methyltransferase